ncbi:OPT oligopeptide transporter protein-domain-containing protein [Scleroderma citrinum]
MPCKLSVLSMKRARVRQLVLTRERGMSETWHRTSPRKRPSTVDGTAYVKGEPIITTGSDVSHFLVDFRDDGDPSLTFRSLFLGTVFACLGAALRQIYLFKPAALSVSTVFLLLLIHSVGLAWSRVLPRRSSVEGTRYAILGPYLEFINHSEFRIKEICEMVYWTVSPIAVRRSDYISSSFQRLPTVSIFQCLFHLIFHCALHFNNAAKYKRMKLFWMAFTGMFLWEIIPSYIFPLLNGFSVFCLASQHASPSVQSVFTNLFGGADGNEGLGLLSISFDWQYITSIFMSLPLTQQVNSWVGYGLCYIILSMIYYSNAWNSKSFPMLSTSLFSSNGSMYDQSAVFGTTFQLNQTALNEVGLPHMTGSNVWHNITNNLAIGGLLAHCICFWGPYFRDTFRSARSGTQRDPHWQAMQKYREVPFWWYVCLLVLSFVSGLIVVLKGQTTLPWYSYVVALLLGSFVTPFSQTLYARLGNGIATNQLMKMVGGAIAPGRPVANLYFSMWSHDIITQSVELASDLKVGQYLKIPPRAMFLTQVWGTVLAVMVSIVNSERDTLLSSTGTNVWSGQIVQSLNSDAVTWSLARELYGPDGQYFIVPLSFLIGVVMTVIQWLIWRRWPRIGPVKVDSVILPVIYMYSASMSSGVNSPATSTVLVGIISQYWLRSYHPGWFRKYNYILGGALDGGAQVMIFILSFAVFGASGTPKPFPSWAGNPAQGNVDYCNGNRPLV